MKKAVRVRPTALAEVRRSAVTCGKAGEYMSVAKGGTAFWIARATMSPAVTTGSGRRRRLTVLLSGRGGGRRGAT